MRKRKRNSVFCLAAMVVGMLCNSANAQDEKLALILERSPAPVNAMGYVNVASLNELMKNAQIEREVAENVKDYWFVADLDLGAMKPKWEAGYSTLKKAITADELASIVDGYTESISDRTVVWSPKQTYFLPMEEGRLGLLRPANRSLLTRWINDERSYNYSEYLSARTKPPEDFLSVMLSVELSGHFSPVPMTAKLEGMESLQAVPAKTAAGVLSSIEGFSVLIGRRGLSECLVQFEFNKSPAGLKLIAPSLLAEILERGGAAAPEVQTWKSSVDKNTLSFRGPITEATLSGLLGVFSLNDAASRSLKPQLKQSSEKDQIAYRSKAYFDEVVTIIERTRDHKSQTTGALAKWNDSRARKIDEMGTLNVDPAMVQYGSDVAELLRGNALTVREGNIKTGMTQAGQSLSSGYGYGYGYDYNSTVDYQRVAGAYNRGNAYMNFKQTLNEIDKRTVAVRRAMTQKYEMEF
ncbi:MAG: hypothetical protein AAF802_12875 [Planctomycetota bacterium]